jgi:hypothetical protein
MVFGGNGPPKAITHSLYLWRDFRFHLVRRWQAIVSYARKYHHLCPLSVAATPPCRLEQTEQKQFRTGRWRRANSRDLRCTRPSFRSIRFALRLAYGDTQVFGDSSKIIPLAKRIDGPPDELGELGTLDDPSHCLSIV